MIHPDSTHLWVSQSLFFWKLESSLPQAYVLFYLLPIITSSLFWCATMFPALSPCVAFTLCGNASSTTPVCCRCCWTLSLSWLPPVITSINLKKTTKHQPWYLALFFFWPFWSLRSPPRYVDYCSSTSKLKLLRLRFWALLLPLTFWLRRRATRGDDFLASYRFPSSSHESNLVFLLSTPHLYLL